MKIWLRTVLMSSAFLAAGAFAQAPNVAIEEYQGIVRGVDIEGSSLIVGGWSFQVPANAPVTIRGSHGALSMLRDGMKVIVEYQRFPDGRTAVSIDQVPDNQEIPEH